MDIVEVIVNTRFGDTGIPGVFMAVKAGSELGASVRVEKGPTGEVVLRFQGRLDSTNTGSLWRQTIQILTESDPKRIIVEADGVDYCDGCGVGLLFDLGLRGDARGFAVEIRGLRPEFQRLLDMFEPAKFVEKPTNRRRTNITEEIGRGSVRLWADTRLQLTYVGHLCAALADSIAHPRQVRWKDVSLTAERAGVNAVGIVAVLGFLFGLIIAFSSAMPLKQFGAEIYVADLVAIGLVRVLGPFITAIVLAARTGSSFAAELGTMKINDEIDALQTMGLEPMSFLVVPRVLATTFVTPLLAILANLFGLVGSAVVLLWLGFPLVTYTEHVKSVIDSGDVFAGLFKAIVYGALVGAVGCLRGLQTKTGASAVGISTTRAVVNSIILIVIAEGIFAVLYYYLGI